LFDVQSRIVRQQILDGHPRIDGRDTRTVRPISIRTGVLPRVHGSALFTRGETQALVTATLGTARDEQVIDAIAGEYKERFMFQYNFPPFSTGETGRVGQSEAPRNWPRTARQAGNQPANSLRRGFWVFASGRFRNYGVKWFLIDGIGLRCDASH